jgi:DNA invertase Pin-like site-specific DNA recombinase
MELGYARVSTNEQQRNGYSLDAQCEALEAAGCERIFRECASGGKAERPELKRLLDQLRQDDVLVVCKLDRLSRSVRDLLLFLDKLNGVGAKFRSLSENLDTTSPAGRAMTQMIAVFAELERGMIRERTKAGLEEARRNGRHGGRPFKLTIEQRREIVRLVRSGQKSAAACARLFNISQPTVSRLLARVVTEAVKKAPSKQRVVTEGDTTAIKETLDAVLEQMNGLSTQEVIERLSSETFPLKDLRDLGAYLGLAAVTKLSRQNLASQLGPKVANYRSYWKLGKEVI